MEIPIWFGKLPDWLDGQLFAIDFMGQPGAATTTGFADPREDETGAW